MKNYELLCILPGTLSEDEVDPMVKQIEDVINKNGGESLKWVKIV